MKKTLLLVAAVALFAVAANVSAQGIFFLQVVKLGSGSGRVDSNPAGIACGRQCWGYFNASSTVWLKATALGSSTFSNWSGACSYTSGTLCRVANGAPSSSVTVYATFN